MLQLASPSRSRWLLPAPVLAISQATSEDFSPRHTTHRCHTTHPLPLATAPSHSCRVSPGPPTTHLCAGQLAGGGYERLLQRRWHLGKDAHIVKPAGVQVCGVLGVDGQGALCGQV